MGSYGWYLAFTLFGGFLATATVGLLALEILYYGWKEQQATKDSKL
eukprot:CAMPEP_0185587528 /NCGR_PEP_ID=MMETSP0434-20130131/49493_1 /TAXON_ID=626734 ORGANISM="Favella taraikaensis, Strain Fe Narragansett Bay" /NCGR_SAMPLE_ID=MMETSP0434 /ASSEMBLY_ACC=CAM_ASM_000379 /LENGTH=45 /DNA_ID= /DNA_START= /DNA_END= /DNA_ORIENTATION=